MNDKPSGPVQGPAPQTRTPRFLDGGGEMGARIRAHDWSSSALGPPARWPPSLRTAVRLMLNTGHPMCLWWGADLICLYNDAYRESMLPEQPDALAQPARKVWGSRWGVIGPQIEQVLSGRGATWSVNDLSFSGSPIDDETASGGIGGVLAICTETSDALLRESEARFHTALTAGRMGSWETDHTTNTRRWSKEGTALFGLTLADGRGQVGGANDEYVAALHPDDRHLAQRFRELAAQQDSFPAEYRIIRPDGTTLWLSGRGLVVERGPQGQALRLVSIMADATERKLAEEQLRTERERLGLALGAGQMGAYDLNIKDDVLWWSPETYALFGVDAERFVPSREAVLELIHPDDRETFSRLRAQAIEQRRPFVHEFRIRRADGTQIWLGHRGQAEYDAEGRPLRSFGVTMDITERKLAEEMLRDADRKKDRFIAILAHELRNPLAPIRNAIHVLRQTGPADPTTTWCHDVIDRQVGQMARLLDDLLDMSRLNRGQLQLRPQPLSLATAIEQAIEIAQPLIDAGEHSFTAQMPPPAWTLNGDLTRLAQVFSNILINAAKYTPPHGRIALTVEQQADQAVVRVTDTGIGIAAEHLSQIFEIFGQVESALNRSQGGQGIGLALAKGLVEMHHGAISVRSPGAGQGSEFEVRLPLMPPVPLVGDLPEAGRC